MEILYHHILTPCGEPADIIISALQKFIRRGKTEEAARAAYELYLSGEELRDYLWQRLLVISAEDVGLGQPAAPSVVLSLYHASQKLGADSMDYPLFFVHAVRYLCSCPKERGSSTLASLTKRGSATASPSPFRTMYLTCIPSKDRIVAAPMNILSLRRLSFPGSRFK